MILDGQMKLSDSQALTATAVSGNTIDTGSASEDIGSGEPMTAVVSVETAADFTDADETYEVQIIQSAAANLGSPDVLASRVISAAALKAASLHFLDLPPGSKTKQYLGMRYVLGGTTPSMTVSAFLQPRSMIQDYKTTPNNYEIG